MSRQRFAKLTGSNGLRFCWIAALTLMIRAWPIVDSDLAPARAVVAAGLFIWMGPWPRFKDRVDELVAGDVADVVEAI